jgi:TPR repeat protein
MTPFHKLMPVLSMLFVLSGCAAAAIQGASRASDQVTIAANESDANAGDARAQYKLGMAHCCTIAGSMGVLNNQKATEWFCKAAAQNNADAQYELGRIYSGDLVRGINGPAKIGALLTKQPENKVLALMWLGLAATNGNKDAIEATRHLSEKMTQDEIDDATARSENPQVQPCEWNDVYPNNQI